MFNYSHSLDFGDRNYYVFMRTSFSVHLNEHIICFAGIHVKFFRLLYHEWKKTFQRRTFIINDVKQKQFLCCKLLTYFTFSLADKCFWWMYFIFHYQESLTAGIRKSVTEDLVTYISSCRLTLLMTFLPMACFTRKQINYVHRGKLFKLFFLKNSSRFRWQLTIPFINK